jgi:hypothetical protein
MGEKTMYISIRLLLRIAGAFSVLLSFLSAGINGANFYTTQFAFRDADILRLFLNAFNTLCAIPCAGIAVGIVCLALAGHIDYHERSEANMEAINQNILKIGRLVQRQQNDQSK